MIGFDKYRQEVEKFKSSKLFKKKFKAFLESMRKREKKDPVISFKIEEGLQVSGADVRSMVQHARRESLPVASSGKGYFWAKNKEELADTIAHLEERRDSLSYTISKLKLAFVEADSAQIKMEL